MCSPFQLPIAPDIALLVRAFTLRAQQASLRLHSALLPSTSLVKNVCLQKEVFIGRQSCYKNRAMPQKAILTAIIAEILNGRHMCMHCDRDDVSLHSTLAAFIQGSILYEEPLYGDISALHIMARYHWVHFHAE